MDGDLQDELDRLASALGRGVSLDGPDGRLIGHSVQGADVDPARVEAILTRQVPPAARAWQDLHRVSSAEHPVRLPAHPEAGMAARLCVPVRRRGVVRALLWVLESDRPLADDEVRLATAYADRLLALLPAERRVPGAAGVSGRLAALLGELVGAGPEEAERLVGAMADLDPGLPGAPARVEVEPGRSAALLRTGRPDVVHRSDRGGRVGPGLAGSAPVVALDATSVRAALARADHAARCGRLETRLVDEAPDRGGRVAWEGLGVWQLLLGADAPRLAAWREPLAPLEEDGDAARRAGHPGAVLLATLQTYLDLAGDAQRAAAALSLHRTTLYYRLGRAAEALGVDLGDGSVRSRLHVALVARRWVVGQER
ncbi:helix-turn-helix domain-containing protein [Nocardioides korecus]